MAKSSQQNHADTIYIEGNHLKNAQEFAFLGNVVPGSTTDINR